MCDKNEFADLKAAVAAVKLDTGNIRDSQKGIYEQMKALNSRTAKSEKRLDTLEDKRIRAAECVQVEPIAYIEKNMLTKDDFKEYVQDLKQEQQRAEDVALKRESVTHTAQALDYARIEKRQRSGHLLIAGLVLLSTIVLGIIQLIQ